MITIEGFSDYKTEVNFYGCKYYSSYRFSIALFLFIHRHIDLAFLSNLLVLNGNLVKKKGIQVKFFIHLYFTSQLNLLSYFLWVCPLCTEKELEFCLNQN